MRMEDDVRTASHRPSRRLRIEPAFVADDDAEFEIADLKELPAFAGDVGVVLARIELNLVLERQLLTVGHEHRRVQFLSNDALRSDDRADLEIGRGSLDAS